MGTSEINPIPQNYKDSAGIDYSEMYRKQEMKQLKKRLRRTRNTLFACALTVVFAGFIFWQMPANTFNSRDFIVYVFVAILLAAFGFISSRKPYAVLLITLVLCLGLWVVEIFWGKADEILIEGTILKLFIISLLVSALHTSKEAELIKKELHFS